MTSTLSAPGTARGRLQRACLDILREHEAGELRWERLAVTADQAEAEGLPPKPGNDHRYADGRPHVSYEAEALGQGRLAEILTTWLDQRLPAPLVAVQERERTQRELAGQVLAWL